MKTNWLDVVIMLLAPLIAWVLVLYINSDLLIISTLLFFGLPSLYIILRNPKILYKSFVFSLLFSVPMSIFVDTLAALNGAYIIPKTIFPFRIFEISTLELYIYAFLWVLLSVLFYEHFFDKGHKGDKISYRIKWWIYFVSTLCFIVISLLFINKDWLYIPYFYLLLGIIFIFLPLVIFLKMYPKFLPRLVIISVYFFYFMLVYELAALATNQWHFPSNEFVGYAIIAGYKFPLEELIIWMIFGTPALLAYYEFFADDRKLKSGRQA